MIPEPLLQAIHHKLNDKFKPCEVHIKDETQRHARHPQAQGRYHLFVEITSPAFEGLDLRARHRLVHSCLHDELAGPLHALRLETRTPDE